MCMIHPRLTIGCGRGNMAPLRAVARCERWARDGCHPHADRARGWNGGGVGALSWRGHEAGAGCSPAERGVDGANEVREDGRTVDALALAAEEGRGHAAKCPGEALAPVIQGSPNGATRPAVTAGHQPQGGRAPGELKHLSTPRKREDSRSSGERNGRSPNRGGVRAGRRCRPGVERLRWRGRPTARWL